MVAIASIGQRANRGSIAQTIALIGIASLLACGGAPARPAPKTAVTTKPAPPPPPPSLPPGHLARADVDGVLAKGPPWILRRVLTEEVMRDGKFVGWRIVKLPAEWSGIDLKTGDVVTRVNGMTIERPEDFFSAWSSLAVASDLRVAYERDGGPRELVYHIDGQAAESPPPAMRENEPPPPRAQPKGPPRKTIVIVGDDPTGESAD
jgi:hypothetical protein